MSLQTLLLGLLRSPASGYELNARIRSEGQHFWSASLSQIYPLLARMESQGLLYSGLASSQRGPPRKLHGLTDAGREALAQALTRAPQMGAERLPWLAEVSLAGAHLDATAAMTQLTRLHHQFTDECARLQTALDASVDEDGPATSPDAYFEHAARRCALATAQARLDWCKETLMELDSVPWPSTQDTPAEPQPGAA